MPDRRLGFLARKIRNLNRKFEGATPLQNLCPPSPLKERNTKGELRRGEASLTTISPFPLIRGRGIKGDGVVKQSLEHTVGKLKTEEVGDDDQANSHKLKG